MNEAEFIAKKSLGEFDPKKLYPKYPGMCVITDQERVKEMDSMSNLITDMVLNGATSTEICRAVKHSMVVIDAKKHELNWRQSEQDFGIPQLKAKYQVTPRHSGEDWIKRKTAVRYNIMSDSNEYTFRDNGVTVRAVVHRLEEAEYDAVAGDNDAHTDYIISKFAREYDNILIRKVLNMDSTRFNRFVSMLNAAGGNFKYENAIGAESMATIQIPASMLYHLHIDGDGSLKEPSKKIPCITDIQVFNDRAVQITFADGSQTKCVCGKDETFDLYEGIAFCLFKRFLGKDTGHKHFNDLMRYAFKKLDEQEKNKKKVQALTEENKRLQEKKKRQAEKRKEKKREEKIGIFVEALKRNRQNLINEMPVYSVPYPNIKELDEEVKPDENPEKED